MICEICVTNKEYPFYTALRAFSYLSDIIQMYNRINLEAIPWNCNFIG